MVRLPTDKISKRGQFARFLALIATRPDRALQNARDHHGDRLCGQSEMVAKMALKVPGRDAAHLGGDRNCLPTKTSPSGRRVYDAQVQCPPKALEIKALAL